MNEPKKRNDRVVSIDKDLHKRVRDYCDTCGMKLGFFAKEAITRHLDRLMQQQESEKRD
jgi:hypothetical protein